MYKTLKEKKKREYKASNDEEWKGVVNSQVYKSWDVVREFYGVEASGDVRIINNNYKMINCARFGRPGIGAGGRRALRT